MSYQFSPADFSRQDESDDGNFYTLPRLVVHIDDDAIAALSNVFRRHVPANARVLDLMSSYRSHLPPEVSYREVVGLGMNAEEMHANTQLSTFVVHNLNKQPTLPFEDASFDAVLNSVSIQYLTHPVEVVREVARVLRPGGVSIIAFSNRMFPTKAVRIWYSGGDEDHIRLVQHYYKLAGGYSYIEIERHEDKSTLSWFSQGHDPLFAIIGTRDMAR
jgi:SAM-dependent methyltransferase